METIEAPPIRYSVGQEDFDQEIGGRLLICLDGAEQREVIEYDCEAGTLTRYHLDAEGRIHLNEAKDEAVRETLSGTVTVEWREP